MATKRGQAALEFLSTYGFAFLIILVMIGALSYFGVLTPQKFLPGRCLVSNEFSCPDRVIVRTGTGATMKLQLVNSLGNTVIIAPTLSNATSQYSTTANCSASPTSVVNGQRTAFTCDLTGSFPASGEKVKIGFSVVYAELGGSYNRTVFGEVADTIQ